MAFSFGKKKPVEQGYWGIGDMGIHIYISPLLSPEHKQAAIEAVREFFDLFPARKDWFKIVEMPWQRVESIVNNQPTTIANTTDLQAFYYNQELDNIYKGNTAPLTTVLVIPHNHISAYNGSGGAEYKHTIIMDLQNVEFLKSTIKHELGHRFGADHCLEANCIMNASGVGTHFCPNHIKEIEARMATMYAKSRPFTFGEPIKSKPSFTFGKPTKSM